VAQPAVSAVISNSAAAPVATKEDLSTLTERISHLRKQAEQLTRELETLENETRKK
jgi:polyhydroxyalkanoate synthesis regulator phasin